MLSINKEIFTNLFNMDSIFQSYTSVVNKKKSEKSEQLKTDK